MAIDPAAISARPATTMMRVVVSAPESPAASAKGTVSPSAMPMTMSRTKSKAVKCDSTCGVCGIFFQVSPSVRIGRSRNLFRCTLCDDLAATIAAFGAKVNDPVRAADDIQVVLDDENAAAVLDQALEGRQELGDVVEMETGGRLVEDIQRTVTRGLRQVRGQLYALRLAAGQRGRRLAQPQVTEADVRQHFQLAHQAPVVRKEGQRLLNGELQDLVNVQAVIPDIQDAALEPRPFAFLAHQFHVGEKLHFDSDGSVTLAILAAA